MRDINWYLDAAKAHSNLPSDARLAAAVGMSQSLMPRLRRGHHLPSAKVMQAIAGLANVPLDEAAIDLARWRAEREGSPAFAAAYARLFRHAAAPIILLALIGGVMPADATQQSRNGSVLSSVYYA